MLKKLTVLAFIFVFSLSQIAFSQVTETSFEVTLPSGNIVKMTKSQLEELLSKPGIGFANVTPSAALPEDQIIIPLPDELGGGHLLGSPETIADGMNAVNITVGATAEFISKPSRRYRTVLVILAAIGGMLALALSSSGGAATPTSH